MSGLCSCQACGRPITADEQIELNISVHRSRGQWLELARRYFVCAACHNSFLVCISDKWAMEIACHICDGDLYVGQFPPLIHGGEYKKAYETTATSVILEGWMSLLRKQIDTRKLHEKHGCNSHDNHVILPDPRNK